MSLVRFPLEQYASLELNQVGFSKTGMVVSQTPLGTYFTKANPCENGMWVSADKSKGVIAPLANAQDVGPVGIVYTTEKEYDSNHYGLKTFGRKIAGDYPRIGIMDRGDTVTTNCLQYDDSEFKAVPATDDDAAKTSVQVLFEALEKHEITPVYVAPVYGSAVPKLTLNKPASGIYGKVTKFYTVPNGERGVKYQIVSL